MRGYDAMRRVPRRRRAGFTLIELGMVVMIIGIIASFILAASFEGVRRAEERATEALITKLDIALTDRLNALQYQQTRANLAHRFFAASPAPAPTPLPVLLESDQRAQTIARIDYLRMELPDVFFVQGVPDNAGDNRFPYPLNFAALPVPGTPAFGVLTPELANVANFILPFGNSLIQPTDAQATNGTTPTFGAVPFVDDPLRPPANLSEAPPDFKPAGSGIYGASYAAAAGLYKNLGKVPQELLPPGVEPRGYNPAGYDGVDSSSPPNGLVDEWSEGVDASNEVQVTTALRNHTHKTARSEMLYAILVEGSGPLGSVFRREDFTAREVGDTDGDGLPEFLDAWGQPLRFYRWPVYFGEPRTDLQVGPRPYAGLAETRQQSPFDPNQQLVAPAWWLNLLITPPDTTTSAHMSPRAKLFSRHYFSLVDPTADAGTTAAGPFWDRGGYYKRRAYYSKFLIASSGPDLRLGIAELDRDYDDDNDPDVYDNVPTFNPGNLPDPDPYYAPPGLAPPTRIATAILSIENQAARSDPLQRARNRPGLALLFQELSVDPLPPSPRQINFQLDLDSSDDLTNHTLKAPGLGVR